MTDYRKLQERNGFKIFMEWREDGTPRNGRHWDKIRGWDSWWFSWLTGEKRRYECKQKFWVSGPSRGDEIRFVFEPGYRFDGPTFYDVWDWTQSIWWPFAACHDQPYKENQLHSRVWKNGENVGTLGNRARVDEFFRDGLIAWGQPAWKVNAAYDLIRAGGGDVWGEH